jgi:hypothetical protein
VAIANPHPADLQHLAERRQWQSVDKVLSTYDPTWVDRAIGDKVAQREQMRRALVAAGLLTTSKEW